MRRFVHRILFRYVIILLGLVMVPLPAFAKRPIAVPTFHSIGLYYSPRGGSEDRACQVEYKIVGEQGWKEGLDLWFDQRNREYRGSLVNLYPGVTYRIRLRLENSRRSRNIWATTWKEQFPVGEIVQLPAGTIGATQVIETSGTPDAYRLYTPAPNTETVIDVDNNADHCLVIDAAYVIVRGLVLKNAGIHAVRLLDGAHDVVIEDCDISGWGRIDTDGFGVNEDAGIFADSGEVKRIVIQRNQIHHPRADSNSWKEYRETYRSYHPRGPKAIALKASGGNHVIRYNEIYSDDGHYFNDGMGESGNFGIGFPNSDTDIYANYIERCWDDGIESEGYNRNVRIWGNYIDRTYVGIASVPVEKGPLYIWRNVLYSSRKGPLPIHNTGAPLFKVGGTTVDDTFYGDGKLFIFHNTSLAPDVADLSAHSTQINAADRELNNCVTRNNILESQSPRHFAILDDRLSPANDFDYDLYNGEVMAVESAELNGFQATPVYARGRGFDPATGAGRFELASSSPGRDAGVWLPNFNDDYTGEAPDIGAHEADTGPMTFGTAADFLKRKGLVGYWPLDERRRFKWAIDKSGMGNHGRLHGRTVRRPGKIGKAVKFQCNRGYVEIRDPGQSALNVTRDLSVSLWLKRKKSTLGDEWFISKSGAYGWKIANSTPYFYIYTPHMNVLESSPIPNDEWVHLVAVYDYLEQTVSIYQNGDLDAVHAVAGEIATTDASLILGHAGPAGLIGLVDEVQIYNRPLSQQEVWELCGRQPPQNVLAGYWKFDEGQGTVVGDASGNANEGVIYGDTAWVAGKIESALELDGDYDYVEIADTSGALEISRDISLVLWIKRTVATAGDEWFMMKPGSYAWKISNSIPYFYLYTPALTLVQPSPISLNEWHQLAAIYDHAAGILSIYIDGELDTTREVSGEIAPSAYPLWLGHNSVAGFGGAVDEFRIYNTALSAQEIRELYGETAEQDLAGYWKFDEGQGTVVGDASGSANKGVIYGDTAWVAGKVESALEFDGDDDYVEIADTSGALEISGDLSVALWIKRTASTAGDEWFVLKPGSYAWKISNNIPYFYIYTPGLTLVEPSPISLDQWHHLAATYDHAAGILSIYIDGELDTTREVGGDIAPSAYPLYLGHNSAACLNGQLDELRIYNRVLSLEEVQGLHQP